jgi:hypothetical protein
MAGQHAQAEMGLPRDGSIKQILVDQPDVAMIETVEAGKKFKESMMSTYRSYDPTFSKETEKRLVKNIDIRLLPIIVTIYIFNYLDRNSITQARLYGLQQDTNVTGVTYNTAISIFSAGYIAMQLPSTLLMTKVQPHIFLVCAHQFCGKTISVRRTGRLTSVR